MANWIDACATDEIDEEDVMRFDHGGRTFAIYHSPMGSFSARTACVRMKTCIWPGDW